MNSGGWGGEGREGFGEEPPSGDAEGDASAPERPSQEWPATPPMPPPPVFDPSSRAWGFERDAPGAASWQWPEIPTRAPRRRTRSLLAAALAALVLLSAGVGIGWDVARRGSTDTTSSRQAPVSGQLPSGGALDVQTIARRVSPAVVDVNSVIGSLFENTPIGQAAGTGMILTSSGQVLTNNHVIEGASSIHVTMAGRSSSYSAHVIGVDPTDDVALIQIEGVSGLPTVSIARSSSLSVGDGVVAIGNALGRGGAPTVTAGVIADLHQSIVVSGDGRAAGRLRDLIQMNATISPGDSGGPLVNTSGQVVGIITAAARDGLSSSGSRVGFAIPVNSALRIVEQIRSGRASAKVIVGPSGYLGIETANLDAAAAARLGLGITRGALVEAVVPGSPADKAGLTKDSVITAVNGRAIDSVDALGPAIHTHRPGDSIRVTWANATGSHTATIELISGPAV